MHKKLVVMLKFPRPGAVKTRLIPALGEHRACELYRQLVAHTLKEANRFAANGEVALEIRIAGAPDAAAARAWLGELLPIRAQGEGDLGERMERALGGAFEDGAEAVVIIGGDCPDLTARHLAWAFAELEKSDVVIGPAADGGYYLIGVRGAFRELFRGIEWSTERVLAQTLAIARESARSVRLLERLRDIDLPQDLPTWARTSTARGTGTGGISVIIAAFDEEDLLSCTLETVRRDSPHEIIVVDGGSIDRTRDIARQADAIVLSAPRCRAVQMNSGAAVATGEYLLFLHADTLLPENYTAHVRRVLNQPDVAAGAFGFAFADDISARRWIECGANLRAHWAQLPYGDQGLFIRRERFFQAGGFPTLPIMEDYAFVRRLRAEGKIAIAPVAAKTSGRRWRRLGVWRTTLLNQAIVVAYHCGVSTERLALWYRGTHPRDPVAPEVVTPTRGNKRVEHAS